jgi:hypothetical protein
MVVTPAGAVQDVVPTDVKDTSVATGVPDPGAEVDGGAGAGPDPEPEPDPEPDTGTETGSEADIDCIVVDWVSSSLTATKYVVSSSGVVFTSASFIIGIIEASLSGRYKFNPKSRPSCTSWRRWT